MYVNNADTGYRVNVIGKPVMMVRCEIANKGEFATVPTGTLLSLLKNPLTPMGIWIDRMEECPEELPNIPKEVISAMVAFFRTQL